VITALVIIILFNNKEEASFWLFGEIRTSKLIILGVFFVLGVIVGGLMFRRRKKHPKEYSISNAAPQESFHNSPPIQDPLSEEDREFLGKE